MSDETLAGRIISAGNRLLGAHVVALRAGACCNVHAMSHPGAEIVHRNIFQGLTTTDGRSEPTG